MSYLKIGCNFDTELITIANRINQRGMNRITEFYGSRRESSFLSARPAFRLPDINRNDFLNYVAAVHDSGIQFNYTLNASYIGAKEQILQRKEDILEYIKFLCLAKVDTITVSLPIMAEFIRLVDSKVGIEVSTIAHIDAVSQVDIWKRKYGITKLCNSLSKNREIRFLKSLSSYCRNNDIVLTLIANEFCGNSIESNSDTSTVAPCIYRDHCYSLHSAGYSVSRELPSDYPMGGCISSRSNEMAWLKLFFIRPEDMEKYNRIGIFHFKITGRTGSTDYLKSVLTAYAEGNYTGNLLNLWKHLETIKTGNELSYKAKYYIPNKSLDGFIDMWFSNPEHVCANEVCGQTCKYCEIFFQKNCI